VSSPNLTVNFTSDYGLVDEFVGICHGVIHRIAPAVKVIDVTHGIQPGNINQAAALLRDTASTLPVGVNLAVVDPGVGSDRRAVAILARTGALFVGPDNGLFKPVSELLGGVQEAVELNTQLLMSSPSNTFHGRDIFAPAAARLANGQQLATLGSPLDPEQLVQLQLPKPIVTIGSVNAECLRTDQFGNAQLNATAKELNEAGLTENKPLTLIANGLKTTVKLVATFTDVEHNEPLLYIDSNGYLAVAVRGNSAERLLDISIGKTVQIATVKDSSSDKT